MSQDLKASARTLYNKQTLSDVKIKQTNYGKTLEYYAHKAVLCGQSEYFMQAFTGSFKEASENEMEFHEDDPDHFEFALKFIYTLEYDKDEIKRLTNNDPDKQLLIPIGIHAVADKYSITKLIAPASDHIKSQLESLRHNYDQSSLFAIISAYYETCADADSQVGQALVDILLTRYSDTAKGETFHALLKDFPTFSTDVALFSSRNDLLGGVGICAGTCSACKELNYFKVDCY
ncbi:hypothetical protein BDV96DRAFT_639606 [Lophiotrema nucula]|uniref:BTB domain-containing protein n=1 Tax=Lophiotrema nucula TaxID=690887 RepID=A0A6A5ZXE4_9PLEO|nr:hypothetical protein BDV96DRAFT_639606 [Lophiotrema nucula]